MYGLIHEMLHASAARRPDAEALVHGERRLTYAQTQTRVASLAAGLRAAGVERGDRVGIYLPPSLEQALAIFGVAEADGVYVPVNSGLYPDQVTHIAADCQMKALITGADQLGKLEQTVEAVPSLELLITVGGDAAERTANAALDFDELCDEEAAPLGAGACIPRDLAALIYTSGSTGKPKGVMLSHEQVVAGSSLVSEYLEITEDDRILAVLPFSFDAGMNQLMTAIQQGGTLVIANWVFGRDIVGLLERERITGLAGVPTLWGLLARPDSGLANNPPPSLRYITNTGGAMPEGVLAKLRELLPSTSVYLMYGLTEAFRSTYLPPEELDRRPTSMGKAIPKTEILVINDEGELCAPGEPGELVHRGPTVSMGYWGRPDLTREVLRPNPLADPNLGDSEIVCYSGDLVRTDEEGFLYFIARRDAMIKSSGYRISPTEVEATLLENDEIELAAVVGMPDELLGARIRAFVVASNGAIDTKQLIRFCAERMPRYMVPHAVEVVDDLPRTTSGKIDYPALRSVPEA